ncbi:MAG: hypothetical protein LBG60_08710, partial [Bifidobacteriaceae bacterium]|nr:hypothetical protein [Bifidobacteriaceae bacterium]
MSAEGLGKAGWRRRVVSERRARLGLDRSSVSDAVPVVSADLASAPGWEAFLPGLGEFVAAFASMADEPSTGRLLAWLAAREVRVLVPAPGPSLGALQWAEVEPATCALPAARPGRPPEPPGPRL